LERLETNELLVDLLDDLSGVNGDQFLLIIGERNNSNYFSDVVLNATRKTHVKM
tara:strand:+ start:1142 stop:1303 length:162 start_codon:yes stop_codon:yes gene_type:complete